MLGELYSMIVIRYNIPQNTGDNTRMRNNSRENISRIRNPVMPAIAKPNNKPVIVAMSLFAVFVLFTVITVAQRGRARALHFSALGGFLTSVAEVPSLT